MTERDKRLKEELKKFSGLLEQTQESATTFLALLAEEPPIIPLTYIHRLNNLLSEVQKELNKVHELYKQDDRVV